MTKKEVLKEYLIKNLPDNYNVNEAMSLISQMNTKDIIEAMDEAFKTIDILKNTPLGKELF